MTCTDQNLLSCDLEGM